MQILFVLPILRFQIRQNFGIIKPCHIQRQSCISDETLVAMLTGAQLNIFHKVPKEVANFCIGPYSYAYKSSFICSN